MSDGLAAEEWSLTLYVNGGGIRSVEAISAVRRVCDQELAGRFKLAVVDAAEHPERVREDRVLAVPTLVKHSPPPARHIVGSLGDVDRLRVGLDLGLTDPAGEHGGTRRGD